MADCRIFSGIDGTLGACFVGVDTLDTLGEDERKVRLVIEPELLCLCKEFDRKPENVPLLELEAEEAEALRIIRFVCMDETFVGGGE